MWRHDQADLPPLRSLVRQQVDLLSRPVLTWEGELMPAIPLTLNVDWLSSPRGRSAPREGYDGTSDAEPLTRCRTRIQIVLPALGKVTATLVDGPRGFSFDLQCASQRGLRALRSLSEVWRCQVQHKLATEVAVMINRSDISAASR
ncbi:hypothetical protein BST95_07480 [Halioglobus japonicus]|uniref:Flagellar hook-length control protein FliK n=1 Tax=Halioglobus japonicus TaxID=930805 RepID=A0AAP8SN24_9GAMM|nr:hypothetical protein BST95_07480 [Halioglobus japonicus]PLW86099.1 hypothetical protein C0029_06525 [Halioglobus japonicus]